VAQAATLTEVSEYRQFALAPVWWTGQPPPAGLLEGVFAEKPVTDCPVR
jgi:hypothetical protein